MTPLKISSDYFRGWVSSAVAMLVGLVVLAIMVFVGGIHFSDTSQWIVPVYGVTWPLYTALYVGWGSLAYSRLGHASLMRLTTTERRDGRRPLSRLLGMSSSTSMTISAAVVAVTVTVAIAQRPEFRGNPIYIALALLTVASSWVLMVFSFSQTYMRLGVDADDGAHFRFHLPNHARFGDYFTLALLLSTMAAMTPAEVTSRAAWRIVRSNVIIAFVFNTVIIAVMVALLFGGLLR